MLWNILSKVHSHFVHAYESIQEQATLKSFVCKYRQVGLRIATTKKQTKFARKHYIPRSEISHSSPSSLYHQKTGEIDCEITLENLHSQFFPLLNQTEQLGLVEDQYWNALFNFFFLVPKNRVVYENNASFLFFGSPPRHYMPHVFVNFRLE